MRTIVVYFLSTISILAQSNPIELGHVHWLRSFDEAQAKSKTENKPILIIFQEIPGCQTCKSYGSDVLTHPLIVEAIETYFIPLAIHNNKGGADAEVLKRYNEPAWNNPVVRIVDQDGKDVVNRLSGNYSVAGLASVLTQAIIKNKGKAPAYLQLLSDELTAQQKGIATATYSMYCFWTGEALFGKVNGVVKTSAGFQSGKESVIVEYDPAIISLSKLNEIADHHQCNVINNGTFKADVTPKYYLSNSKFKTVPMTELQKCRVNSALADGLDPEEFLSPRQLAYLNKTPVKNRVSMAITEAW
jgi:hypothetical protein